MEQLIKMRMDKKGFSTIELMMALAILSLIMSAVIMISFGNQNFFVDSQTNTEALHLAEGLLEEELALGRQDFNLINPKGASVEDIYEKSASVSLLSDFLTKEVRALVSWQSESQLPKAVELTTLITNFDGALGANTCDSTLSDDWAAPEIESVFDFSSASVHFPAGTYTLTDLDAYKNKLYVTAGRTTNAEDPTLFRFDISDPANPHLEGGTDNAPSTIFGLGAVRVAEAAMGSKIYAYAGSNTSSNYSSCNPIDPVTLLPNSACGQLYVFDVTGSPPEEKAHLKITSSPALTGQSVGTSIHYRNGYVFLGLSANTGGREFYIIDAHKPNDFASGSLAPVGSFEVGNAVNAISVRNMYAYISSPNAEELKILNIENPSDPVQVGGFSLGSGNGKSLGLVGDKIYFGRTTDGGSGEDFQILDNQNPRTTLPLLGGLNVASSVNGVIVRDYLTFLMTGTPGTGSQLKIIKTDDPANISEVTTLQLSPTGHATEPSIVCEGNRIYVAANDGSGQGKIYIIKPGS
jgi:prepilin-type N-terminal cleavage/methylation domain-containing protein